MKEQEFNFATILMTYFILCTFFNHKQSNELHNLSNIYPTLLMKYRRLYLLAF